ncbi:MAG: hypothetical protein K6G03_03730 [Lachnospiraceae bacterium]|nr:hypothetical protein [Lachnospiraceae bacterium]
MERNEKFIQREYRRELIPVMISVLAGTVNTLIDSAFVTRRLNSDALAAVNLSMPVFLSLCMVGSLIGVGAFTVASRAIGKREEEEAKKYYHSALFLSVVCGLFFMVLGIFFSNNIARAMCKDATLLPMLIEYCRVTLIGAFPYILIYIPTYFIQLEGNSKAMTVMMNIMIVTDIIFDWFFLYILDLGITGAALASVLSMLLACIYGFIILQAKEGMFVFRPELFRLFGLKEIIMFGSSAALSNFMATLRMIVLNWIIYSAGGADGLAVWAVINSLMELSICITSGIPRTGSPLLGIYSSGHDNEGVRMIVRYEIKVGMILAAVFAVLIIVLNHPIAIFFKLDQPLLIPFICLGISLILEVCVSVLSSFYNVSRRFLLADAITILKTFVFASLFAFLLLVSGISIWLFMPLSMLASLIAILLYVRSKSIRAEKKGNRLSAILLLDDHLQNTNKIKVFSIESSDENICQASEDISEFCVEQNMNRKTAIKLGLALEEVMTVMARRSLKKENDPVDIRIYSDKNIGLTIMCSGNRYNLFQVAETSDDEANMGVQMINNMAKECHYLYTLGMNILTVEF